MPVQWIIVTPEEALEMQYLTDFQRQRLVRQNLFYTESGAESFYRYRNPDFDEIRWQDEVDFFRRQAFWTPEARVGFVSLGCGNAAAERRLLRQMHALGAPWMYYGADSSRRMLELAEANLATEGFPATLLLADFTQPAFRETCARLLAGTDARIYAALGGTFGNFDPAQIGTALHTLIPPGDYLYLDVVPKPETPAELAQLEARYAQLAVNYEQFFANVLTRLCIPQAAGEVISETGSDPGLDTLRCTFRFRARERLEFPCFNEMIPLYPGETLELLTIRAYDAARLREWLAGWGFREIDAYLPDVGRLSHRWLRTLFVRE